MLYVLYRSQNELTELLEVSNTLCGGQKRLSEVLQASYTLCCD